MKKKNFRKLVLSLGTLATVIAPITAVISCGNNSGNGGSDGTTPNKIGHNKENGATDGANVVNADSAFYSEATLTATIKDGNINKILESIKEITLEELQGFVESMTVDGTKLLIHTIAEKVSSIKTNILPFVIKVMETSNVDEKIINLVKKIDDIKGVDGLFDFLDSKIESILNGLDSLITEDFIKNLKEKTGGNFIELTFKILKGALINDLEYDSPEMFVVSLYNVLKKSAVILGGVEQLKPFLGLFDSKKDDGTETGFVRKVVQTLLSADLIPESFKGIVEKLFNSDRAEKLFNDLLNQGVLDKIMDEIIHISEKGIQNKTQEDVDRIANIFEEFKVAYPEVKSIDSQAFSNTLFDLLANGVGLSDESINTIIEIAKILLPNSNVEEIIKTITSKSIFYLTNDQLKAILRSLTPSLSTPGSVSTPDAKTDGQGENKNEFLTLVEKLLDTNFLEMIRDGLTLGKEYTELGAKYLLNDFKADLRSILPDSIVNFKKDIPIIGSISFDSIVEAMWEEGTVLGAGKLFFESIHDLIVHGLKDNSIKRILGFLDTELWDAISPYLPTNIIPLIRSLIDNKEEISHSIYVLFKEPIASITASDFENIIKIINTVSGKTIIPIEMGNAIHNLLHNSLLTPLDNISDILDLVKQFLPNISDDAINIIHMMLPIILIGNEEVENQKTTIPTEFAKLNEEVEAIKEVTLVDGAIMPSNYDETSYAKLISGYNEQSKNLETQLKTYDAFNVNVAFAKLKKAKTGIEVYNTAIEAANSDFAKLQEFRNDFIDNYGPSHKVVDMNEITATDHEDLDTSYDVVKTKLEELYNTDVTNMSIDDINLVLSQITSFEALVTELNDLITKLNNGDTTGIQPVVDKISTLKFKAKFDAFKLKFDVTNDGDRTITENGLFAHTYNLFSLKAEILGKFIDDNLEYIFGDEWTYDFTSGKFGSNYNGMNTFENSAKFGALIKDMREHHIITDQNLTTSGFIIDIIKRALTLEDFAKVQEFVLDPLGVSITTQITDAEVKAAVTEVTGENHSGVLTITNSFGATVTADKTSELANGDEVTLSVVYDKFFTGPTTVTYTVSNLVLTPTEQIAADIAAEVAKLDAITIPDKATPVDGVAITETYPDAYVRPTSFATVAEVTAEIAKKQVIARDATAYNFVVNYGSEHKVKDMNAIIVADHKHLDDAYDATKTKLEELYNTDVTNLSLEDITKVLSQITNLEAMIVEINDSIIILNDHPSTDTEAIIDKLWGFNINVAGLHPIDKAELYSLKEAFNKANDDFIEVSHIFNFNTYFYQFSKKAQVLAKFIDKNLAKIIGDNNIPNYDNTGVSGKSSFEEIATYESDILIPEYDANDFIVRMMQKALTLEDFAKVQEFVLDPLGVSVITELTEADIEAAIKVDGINESGILTVNPIGATITADKSSKLKNGDKVILRIVYDKWFTGPTTITYTVSNLLSYANTLTIETAKLAAITIPDKATHVDGVNITETYPDAYVKPTSFATIEEVTAEIAKKQKVADDAIAYNKAYDDAAKIIKQLAGEMTKLTNIVIPDKATPVDGVANPTLTYPPAYSQPSVSTFATIEEVTAEIAKKQKVADDAIAYNTAYARVVFANEYGSKSIVTMNQITASDSKHLDDAYNAVKTKLEELYNTDVSNSSLEDIDEIKRQISSFESIITELNALITALNGDATIDTQPILDKIKNLKVLVGGLSPIDNAVFDAFKLKFDEATDDKRVVSSWRGDNDLFSLKSQLLAKFIDENLAEIIGNSNKPNYKNITQLSFINSFVQLADEYGTEKEVNSPKVIDFINKVIKVTLTPEDFARVQEFVLYPLGLSVATTITNASVEAAISVDGENHSGVLTIANPNWGTITASKTSGLSNGDEITLSVSYGKLFDGSATIKYTVSGLELTAEEKLAVAIAAEIAKLDAIDIPDKATPVDGVTNPTLTYPPAYSQPDASTFATVAEITAEIAEKQKVADDAEAYNEFVTKLQEFKDMAIPPKATHNEDAVEPSETYPDSYVEPALDTLTTLDLINEAIANKQSAIDEANTYNIAYAKAVDGIFKITEFFVQNFILVDGENGSGTLNFGGQFNTFGVTGTTDTNGSLSNGDVVTVNVVYGKGFIGPKTVEYEVSGLTLTPEQQLAAKLKEFKDMTIPPKATHNEAAVEPTLVYPDPYVAPDLDTLTTLDLINEAIANKQSVLDEANAYNAAYAKAVKSIFHVDEYFIKGKAEVTGENGSGTFNFPIDWVTITVDNNGSLSNGDVVTLNVVYRKGFIGPKTVEYKVSGLTLTPEQQLAAKVQEFKDMELPPKATHNEAAVEPSETYPDSYVEPALDTLTTLDLVNQAITNKQSAIDEANAYNTAYAKAVTEIYHISEFSIRSITSASGFDGSATLSFNTNNSYWVTITVDDNGSLSNGDVALHIKYGKRHDEKTGEDVQGFDGPKVVMYRISGLLTFEETLDLEIAKLDAIIIPNQATLVDGITVAETYPDAYVKPTSFGTIEEVTAEIAKKQKVADDSIAYNTAYARAVFENDYSSKTVVAMNQITASDSKHLDDAYDAVKTKLEELYATDVTNLSLEDVIEVTNQISSFESIITELNDLIDDLNSGKAIDTKATFDKMENLNVSVWLSPVDKTTFDTFKSEYDASADDKRENGGKPLYSVRAEQLGKFIDDNSKDIFGEDWGMPMLKDKLPGKLSWQYVNTFAKAASDRYGGYEIVKVNPQDAFSARSFIDDILKASLTPEDFAKLQELVLEPLGFTTPDEPITDDQIKSAIKVSGENHSGVLTITNPVGATITADKTSGLENEDEVTLKVIFKKGFSGSTTIKYTVSNLKLTSDEQTAYNIAMQSKRIDEHATLPKAPEVPGVTVTEVYPDPYVKPASFATVKEVLDELLKKINFNNAASAYNIAYAAAVELAAKLQEFKDMKIPSKATYVDGTVEPSETYPDPYVAPDLDTLTTLDLVNEAIANKQSVIDEANAYNTAYANAVNAREELSPKWIVDNSVSVDGENGKGTLTFDFTSAYNSWGIIAMVDNNGSLSNGDVTLNILYPSGHFGPKTISYTISGLTDPATQTTDD